jgi:hypothetical protein
MRYKAAEGFYSVIYLTDAKREKRLNIGVMMYIPGECLKAKFEIREEQIRKLSEVESAVESYMASAYLCRTRIAKLEKEVTSRGDIDSFITTRSGNVLFTPLEAFKLGCAPETLLDKLFTEAMSKK